MLDSESWPASFTRLFKFVGSPRADCHCPMSCGPAVSPRRDRSREMRLGSRWDRDYQGLGFADGSRLGVEPKQVGDESLDRVA